MAKISAKGRRQKGQRAERQVRDLLKKLYTAERRDQIHRVPMSGASYTKGDVVDLNDNSWSYEVKAHETLALHEWWRQTKIQASSFQTACLIFTSNNRPFYWVLKAGDWESYEGDTVFDGVIEYVDMTTRGLYAKLATLTKIQVAHTTLDGDEVVIVPTELFLALRKDLLREKEAPRDAELPSVQSASRTA